MRRLRERAELGYLRVHVDDERTEASPMGIFIMRAAKEVMSNCGEEKGRDEGSLVSLHIALARTARSSNATTSPSLTFDAAPPTAAVSELTPNSDGEVGFQ